MPQWTGQNDLETVENVKIIDSEGNEITTANPFPVADSGGGGAVNIADGADVAEGSTTDAAVTTDTTGTISGKLRGVVSILKDIWNSTNNFIRVLSLDIMLAIPAGWLTGYFSLNKFGHSHSGIQTTPTDVWDRADATPTQQIWLAPTAARIHTIASTSIQDDTGGTGANSVIVFYLADWDTAETSETVTGDLNAGIAMNNAAVIIHRMRVVPQASSTISNAGTITATAASDATVTAQINIGEGQTQMAIYGIPSTQTLYLTQWYASTLKAQGTAASISCMIVVNPNPNIQTLTYLIKQTRGLQSTGASEGTWTWKPYFKITGPAIIKVQGEASSADLEASAGFDGMLVNN